MHTLQDPDTMPPEEQSRETSVDRLSFPMRTAITVVVQVVTLAIFFTMQRADLTRLGEIVTEMRDSNKERNDDEKVWRGKTEAELQEMRVRMAIMESNLHLQQQPKMPNP